MAAPAPEPFAEVAHPRPAQQLVLTEQIAVTLDLAGAGGRHQAIKLSHGGG